MENNKHTQGPFSRKMGGLILGGDGLPLTNPTRPPDEMDANVDLLFEALTVSHESGYTPRQLWHQRNDLLELLKQLDIDLNSNMT